MYTLVTILHVVACFTLILIVLLQAGKGANMGAAFGGSSQTVFGSSGAGTFLGKMTAAVAVVFMLTSLTLAYSAGKKGPSLVDRAPAPVTREAAPVIPMPAPEATQQPAQETK
jgi:preprotein translocase subunit SecG